MDLSSSYDQGESNRSLECTRSVKRKGSPESLVMQLIHGKEKPSGYCYICKRTFSMLNKRRVCSNCRLAVCKLHSGNKPKICEVTCDKCKKEKCRAEIEEGQDLILESLKNQLKEIFIGDSENRVKFSAVSRKYTTISGKMASTTGISQSSLSRLEKSLISEKERSEQIRREFSAMQQLHSSAKQKEDSTINKYASLSEELSTEKKDSDRLIASSTALQDELASTYKSATELLNLKELKKLLCVGCYTRVKVEMGEMLYPDMPLSRRDRKEKVCGSCSTF